MKPKTMILLVVAVGCGLGASIMTSRLLADRGKSAEAEPTVKVLVAKAKVAGYLPMKEPEKLFEPKEFPVSLAPKRPVSEVEQLKDQKLNKSISEGHMLLQDDVLTKEQQDITALLQPGQRAVAIKVNAESLVGGFVLPGTRVDVMATLRGNDASGRLLLQNMLVVAVDQKSDPDAETKTIIGQTVTLAATPDEAVELKLAQSSGELSLLLKARGDNARVGAVHKRLEDIGKNSQRSGKTEDPGAVAVGPVTPPSALPLKPLPDEKKEEPKVVVKEDPKPEPVREQPRKKPHVMRIITGANVQKVEFDPNKDDDDDSAPAAPAAPAKKPDEKKPAPAAGPKPADAGAAGRVGRTRTGK